MSNPRDVIVAALTVAIPCPICERVEQCRCMPPKGYSKTTIRADLIEAALVQEGHLSRPSALPTDEEVNEAAMFLAEQSRHPRYVQSSDGWEKLLQSTVDVEMAYVRATAVAAAADQSLLTKDRAMLLAWHQRQQNAS